jgi:hypothetical protein
LQLRRERVWYERCMRWKKGFEKTKDDPLVKSGADKNESIVSGGRKGEVSETVGPDHKSFDATAIERRL